jgi:hypothetical protein
VISFEVDVSELKRLAQLVPAMATIVEEEMDKAMDESGALLTLLVAPRVPVNYGLARASIAFARTGSSRGTLQGMVASDGRTTSAELGGVSTREYVNYLEFGTRAHWPPLKPLKLWALRKFGDEKIGYMVARKIAKQGTWAKGMFFLAWHQGGQRRVEKIWRGVPAKAVRRFETEVGVRIARGRA